MTTNTNNVSFWPFSSLPRASTVVLGAFLQSKKLSVASEHVSGGFPKSGNSERVAGTLPEFENYYINVKKTSTIENGKWKVVVS